MLVGAVTSHMHTSVTETFPRHAEACRTLILCQRQALAGAQRQG